MNRQKRGLQPAVHWQAIGRRWIVRVAAGERLARRHDDPAARASPFQVGAYEPACATTQFDEPRVLNSGCIEDVEKTLKGIERHTIRARSVTSRSSSATGPFWRAREQPSGNSIADIYLSASGIG